MSADPLVAEVDVAGMVLRIETTTTGDMALITRIVGTAPAGRAPDAIVRIGDTSPPLPDRPPDFSGPYGEHWDDPDLHSFRHHWGLGAVVAHDSATLGGDASGHERWVTVRNSMLFVLGRLFLERDRFLLHGAAFRRGARGVVAIGDSGTGKSTLAHAASLAGWTVLADDMVVIDPAGVGPSMRGVPRVPSIPGEVARHTGATGESVPRDPRDRIELVGRRVDLSSAPVSAVIVCAHSSAEGSITRLDPVAALHELIPAFVLADLNGPLRRWFPVAASIAHDTCVRLEHASSLADRLAGAGPLLDQVDAMCDRTGDGRDHRP